MIRQLVIATHVWLLASTVWATPEQDFATCATKTGKEYVAARDRYLAAPAKAEFLKAKFAGEQWRERLAARILQGWQANADEYQKLLAAPPVSKQTLQKYYPWALAVEPIPDSAVPLMFEVLLKEVGATGPMDGALALANLAQEKPETPLDVQLLHRFLDEADEATKSQRQAVAWLLGALPANYQDSDLLVDSLKLELAHAMVDREVVDMLLRAMSHAAQPLDNKERDALVETLLALAPLKALLDPVEMTYAVGEIGGDKGSAQVAKYLAETPKEIEKRWALATLGYSNSKLGTEVLLTYADSKNDKLRGDAIAALGKAPYLPAVGDKLEALALSDQTPQLQQRQAARSLALISAKQSKNKELQAKIKKQLQNISAAKSGDAGFKAEMDRLLKNLK